MGRSLTKGPFIAEKLLKKKSKKAREQRKKTN
jgi:ribosomal protein S19